MKQRRGRIRNMMEATETALAHTVMLCTSPSLPGPLLLLDTNLVVGAFFGDPLLQPLWTWCQAQPRRHACSALLLAECRHVLQRLQAQRPGAWTDDDVSVRLQGLFGSAVALSDAAPEAQALMAQTHPAPDPGDQFLWNLLVMHPTLVLVTRDKRLLKSKGSARPMRPRIWTVARAEAELSLAALPASL